MTRKQRQTVKDLRRWADFLAHVLPGNFYMGTWKSGPASLYVESMNGECGTTACAGGWATAISQFRRRGFRLLKGSRGDGTTEFNIGYEDPDGVYREYEAIEKFFDLSYSAVRYVCSPVAYDSCDPAKIKEAVISRIRCLADAIEKGSKTIRGNSRNVVPIEIQLQLRRRP